MIETKQKIKEFYLDNVLSKELYCEAITDLITLSITKRILEVEVRNKTKLIKIINCIISDKK